MQVLRATSFFIDDERAEYYFQVLREQSRMVKNDWRQHNYCKFINTFTAHFGRERCMVVGSTTEGTRLRSRRDEGDYDYLLISDVVIPVETLENRPDVPCFVHINVNKTKSSLSNLSTVDGKYMNSSLLKYFDESVFKVLRSIYDVFTMPSLILSEKYVHIKVNKEVKPGHNQMHFAGFENLDVKYRYLQVEADIKAITKQLKHLLAKSTISDDMISLMSNIFSILEELRPEDIESSLTFQTFGALIKAGTDETLTLSHSENPEESCEKDICHMDGTSEDPLKDREGFPENAPELITILFDYKSGRDFIPAFPLAGVLPCLTEWRSRLLKSKAIWPSRETIEQIYRSEYYVIAKPAVVDPEPTKDFCIGFNNAEMILAASFSAEQKLCFLLLKSLQKGFLKEFSERLTSYHWKSAFYHVLETTKAETFATHSGIFFVLKEVLDYMVTCLERRFLPHYFINSNLIAHFTAEECQKIISSIQTIIAEPAKTLDVYFSPNNFDEKLVDQIPNAQIEDLRNQEGDLSRKTHAEAIISLVENIQKGTGNDPSKFVDAITDTLAMVVKAEAGIDCFAPHFEFCAAILNKAKKYLNTKFKSSEDRKEKLQEFAPIFALYLSHSFG